MKLGYRSNLELPNPKATVALVLLCFMLAGIAWGATAAIIAARHHGAPWVDHGPIAVLLFLGIPFGIVGLGITPGYFVALGESRRVARCRQAMLDGNYLVRWSYALPNWRAFRESRLAREDRRWWIICGILMGCELVALLICFTTWLIGPAHNETNGVRVVEWLMIAVAGIGGVIQLCYVVAARNRRELLRSPQDTIVCTLGAYANGVWILWGTGARRLTGVEVKPGEDGAPTTLEFSVEVGEVTQEDSVLVPADQAALAHQVADRIMQSPGAQEGGEITPVSGFLRLVWIVLRIFVE